MIILCISCTFGKINDHNHDSMDVQVSEQKWTNHKSRTQNVELRRHLKLPLTVISLTEVISSNIDDALRISNLLMPLRLVLIVPCSGLLILPSSTHGSQRPIRVSLAGVEQSNQTHYNFTSNTHFRKWSEQ